jgi:ATP-binding protein involved in chromosome partitioning
MHIQKEDILKALGTVEEPDLKKDLVTLNMIRDLDLMGNKLVFTVVLTTPACPLKELIRKRCVDAIHSLVSPDLEIEINMIAEVTSGRTGPVLPGVKNIIAIASGKGGVGKSTVTANLAVALSRLGASVGIIDADIFGPSIPTMFDVEEVRPRVVEDEQGQHRIIPIQQYGVHLISIGFLADPKTAIVWRGPMASSALRQFINDCEWGELDYLLVDLPPGTSDIHLTLTGAVPLTGALIVTTPQKVAVADARKGLSMFLQPQINVPVLGIVENMAWFTPLELPNTKYHLFGEGGAALLSEEFNIPVLAQIPLVQGIREAGDEGKPAVMQDPVSEAAFIDLAEALARAVAIRNADKSAVEA